MCLYLHCIYREIILPLDFIYLFLKWRGRESDIERDIYIKNEITPILWFICQMTAIFGNGPRSRSKLGAERQVLELSLLPPAGS